MTFTISGKSLDRLNAVHPDIRKVTKLAAQMLDDSLSFIVTEGLRTKQRQEELVQAGASQTMKSRHLTGHAVDLAAVVGGEVRWDWPLYARLASAMKDAARDLGIALEWGGDWHTLKDGPHFQLSWEAYP